MATDLVPRYYQIKQVIKKWIVNREVGMGDKIPSENELAAQFQVSRLTVRQALAQLIQEGFLESRRGDGTYVTKNAGLIRREYPDMEINICFIDFRAAGRSYEEYYRNLRSMGINLIKGRPSEILDAGDGKLVFDVFDMQTGKLLQVNTDMVILSTALVPSKGTKDMISTLHLVYGPDGFIKPVHVKIAPVDTSVAGLFIAGGSPLRT